MGFPIKGNLRLRSCYVQSGARRPASSFRFRASILFVFINIPGCTLNSPFPRAKRQVWLFIFNNFWGNPSFKTFSGLSHNMRGGGIATSPNRLTYWRKPQSGSPPSKHSPDLSLRDPAPRICGDSARTLRAGVSVGDLPRNAFLASPDNMAIFLSCQVAM
jgi:hypothetical protein